MDLYVVGRISLRFKYISILLSCRNYWNYRLQLLIQSLVFLYGACILGDPAGVP